MLGRGLCHQLADLGALRVARTHRQLCLPCPQRHGLAVELELGRDDRVLERIARLGQLLRHQTTEACFLQALEAFVLLPGGLTCGARQFLKGPTRKEICVARNDGGLLARLLLADAHGAPLFRAFVHVLGERRLERRSAISCAHSTLLV